MILYLLVHSREVEKDVTCSIIIGIYSSMEIVNTTIEKYKNIVGFKDYPEDFFVEEFEVNSVQDTNKKIGQHVYFLQHEYSVGDYDYITNIGMFLKYREAKTYRDSLKKEPEYNKCFQGLYEPDGFTIDRYVLDEDHWKEGFIEY